MATLTDLKQLAAVLARGSRPQEEYRLGLEYELFITDDRGKPAPYSGPGGVEELLRHLAQETGWKPRGEGEHILSLVAEDGRSVTLEPGAQIEFNTSQCRTVQEVEAELRAFLVELRKLSERFGVRFLGLGAQPQVRPDDIERIPKSRYDIMEPYLREAGELGLWMMKATAGIQVNFDHADPVDAARKLRLAFRMAPVLCALYANSPLRAGEPSGFATWRGHVWSMTDPTRCGIVESCAAPDSTLDDYVRWALDAPMLFIERGEKLLDMRGTSFLDHMGLGQATEADWTLHLSTLFPEVRLRPQLELRCVDSACPDRALALAALVKGLFYSEEALRAVEELTEAWHPWELSHLWKDAHHRGLQAPTPDGRQLVDHARDLLACTRLPESEVEYLAPLHKLIEGGLSRGEEWGRYLNEPWTEDYHEVVEESFCI